MGRKKGENQHMESSLPDDLPRVGLRERKKAKTRTAIQREALRLFGEQGYDATTIEQISDAAEVSPSTFFRYFPTKEDVLLFDATDMPMIESFAAQPRELSVMDALRAALRDVYSTLTADEMAREHERHRLIRSVPEARARMMDEFVGAIQMLAEVIAERVGRPADDVAVRTLAGALIGALISVYLAAGGDVAIDQFKLLDMTLSHLETGLNL